MFKELQPLLAEGRKVHIVLATSKAEGKVIAYIEPGQKDDKEPDAFSVPFKVEDAAEALDAGLAAIIVEWLAARQGVTASLETALAEVKRLTEEKAEADKKKAEENKAKFAAKKAMPAAGGNAAPTTKPAPTPTVNEEKAAPATAAVMTDDATPELF